MAAAPSRFMRLKRIKHQGAGHFVRCEAGCLTRRPVGRRGSRGAKAAPHMSARTSKLAAHIQ
ncbi:hypothetical protein AYM40_13730 [Paraburkholderia phytofirmans OLGA172]|uniref:Uncharacterized protein n=1 Tax=Paraburkholderia phytofirmans OLGA172 TaxID=1417228 RepID=A0A160FLG6_9BURK|nr:hypothetical protein AYM40_13730 [Paraburkholderia phytofirmans OLGA172]